MMPIIHLSIILSVVWKLMLPLFNLVLATMTFDLETGIFMCLIE